MVVRPKGKYVRLGYNPTPPINLTIFQYFQKQKKLGLLGDYANKNYFVNPVSYRKCSKMNTFHFLLSKKMWVIRAGIHKMLVKIANREDPDQTEGAV